MSSMSYWIQKILPFIQQKEKYIKWMNTNIYSILDKRYFVTIAL